MGFAANLSRLMEYHNISMYRLAKEVGVHQTTVKNWLEEESEPKIAALEKIVGLLGVSTTNSLVMSSTTHPGVQSGQSLSWMMAHWA